MNHLASYLIFLLSLSAFSQHLKVDPLELPLSLNVLESPNFQNRLTHVNDFKMHIKLYPLTNDELERVRKGNFVINTKIFNENFTFSELPTIDLKKELRNVILAVPGTDVPVCPRGFTL